MRVIELLELLIEERDKQTEGIDNADTSAKANPYYHRRDSIECALEEIRRVLNKVGIDYEEEGGVLENMRPLDGDIDREVTSKFSELLME